MLNLRYRCLFLWLSLGTLCCNLIFSQRLEAKPQTLTPIFQLLLLYPTVSIIYPDPIPVNVISGKLTSGDQGYFLSGYSVRVRLKNNQNVVIDYRVVTLNSQGEGTYLFSPALGAYFVDAIQDAGNPWCLLHPEQCLNVCFGGTDPALRAVTLSEGHEAALDQDFIVDWSIRFGGGGICWP